MECYRPSKLPFGSRGMFQQLRSSLHEPFGPQPSGISGFRDCRLAGLNMLKSSAAALRSVSGHNHWSYRPSRLFFGSPEMFQKSGSSFTSSRHSGHSHLALPALCHSHLVLGPSKVLVARLRSSSHAAFAPQPSRFRAFQTAVCQALNDKRATVQKLRSRFRSHFGFIECG